MATREVEVTMTLRVQDDGPGYVSNDDIALIVRDAIKTRQEQIEFLGSGVSSLGGSYQA